MVKEAHWEAMEIMSAIGSAALAVGALVTLAALAWIVSSEWTKYSAEKRGSPKTRLSQISVWHWLVPLGLSVLAAAVLRLADLDEKTISHPEVYVPGIPLPAGISSPPPRMALAETLYWHFFSEPHPLGFYLAMFGWTKLFGTSLVALRLPSALLGIASIPILYRIGSLAYGRTVGIIGATMLAMHGLHIYWSQNARMYVPGCFLGLIATWLLLEILRAKRASLLIEACYVLALVAGFFMQWFFWMLAGAHVLWSMLHYGKEQSVRRLLGLQLLAIVLGAPILSQLFNTMWLAGSGSEVSLTTLISFLSFGFLLDREIGHALPSWLTLAALMISVSLFARGMAVRPASALSDCGRTALGRWPIVVAALGVTIFMVGLALKSVAHIRSVGAISVFPIAALCMLPIAAIIGPRMRSRLDVASTSSAFAAAAASPIVILSLIPTLSVFILSMLKPMVAPRALLIFVPYFLLVVAAGLESLRRFPRAVVPVGLAVAAMLVVSILHFRSMPNSLRDYQTLAQTLAVRLEPDDLIFVTARDWQMTPIFYYLDKSQLVAENYVAAIESRRNARVWMIIFGRTKTEEMLGALNQFTLAYEVAVQNGRARLYIRSDPVD